MVRLAGNGVLGSPPNSRMRAQIAGELNLKLGDSAFGRGAEPY